MAFVVRAAQASEYEEILDLTAAAFAPRASRDYFHHAWQNDVNFAPELHRVGVLDGRIVAAVRIAKKLMRVGGAQIHLGGIADVSTHPDARGHGYSTACLEDAIGFMEGNDFDLSMLFTGIHAFYRRLGWEVFPTWQESYGLPEHLPDPDNSAFTIVPFQAELHNDGVARVYQDFNEGRLGPIVRTPQQYRGTLWRHLDPEGFLVVVQEAEVIAYVRGSLLEPVTVFEYGTRESAPAVGLYTALRAFIRAAHSRGARSMTVTPAIRQPPNEAELFMLGAKWIIDPFDVCERTSMMLRIVNLNRLFIRLLPELHARIQRFDQHGHVAFSAGSQLIGLRWDGTQAIVTEGVNSQGTMKMTPITMLKVLFSGDIPAYLASPWDCYLAPPVLGLFTWWPPDDF